MDKQERAQKRDLVFKKAELRRPDSDGDDSVVEDEEDDLDLVENLAPLLMSTDGVSVADSILVIANASVAMTEAMERLNRLVKAQTKYLASIAEIMSMEAEDYGAESVAGMDLYDCRADRISEEGAARAGEAANEGSGEIVGSCTA